MPSHAIVLQPPRDFQVFEDFCRDLFRAEWGDALSQKYGRDGQKQHGIDIFGTFNGTVVGVQCKKRSPEHIFTEETIRKEVVKAKKFTPKLSHFILATTAKRSTRSQDAAIAINLEHQKCEPKLFVVEIRSWEELVEMCARHPEVLSLWLARIGIPTNPSVMISRLPANAGVRLVGRETEILALDQAWLDANVNVYSLVAFGGVGKTALVQSWIDSHRDLGWPGAEKVITWSFYSRSSREPLVSSDRFLTSILKELGDSSPERGSPSDRGRRLAQLIQTRRALLILDGIEALQYRNGGPGTLGRVWDPGVATLIRELVICNRGLLVVTTRLEIVDLVPSKTVIQHVLGYLDVHQGVALLRNTGVKGRTSDCEAVAKAMKGHALSLTLLGSFLAEACKGDVRAWRNRGAFQMDDESSHSYRVISAYDDWFGDGPERQILRMVGLFDRPLDQTAIDALCRLPGIYGLTDKLVDLSLTDWQRAISRLTNRARLLIDSEGGGGIDAHPMVREYFGRRLEAENHQAWLLGHEKLYLHYRYAAEDRPNTLEQMQLLYFAVGHGCRAGRAQEAFGEVYWPRISNFGRNFGISGLGAVSADLNALTHFFRVPWKRPVGELNEADQDFVLRASAFRLRALGRIDEAYVTMKECLSRAEQNGQWTEAAEFAGSVSGLALSLGRIGEAILWATKGVNLAGRGGEPEIKNRLEAVVAYAKLQRGESKPSAILIRAAGRHARGRFSNGNGVPLFEADILSEFFLYAISPLDGSILRMEDVPLVKTSLVTKCKIFYEFAMSSLSSAQGARWPLGIAASLLAVGRSMFCLSLARLDYGGASFGRALAYTSKSIDELRKIGGEHILPGGLLARAACYRLSGKFSEAQTDLSEVIDSADRSGMKLVLTDAYIESSRLLIALGDLETAKHYLSLVRCNVKSMQYFKRNREIGMLAKHMRNF